MEETPQDVDGSGLSAGQMWHHFRRYPYLLAKLVFWGLIVVGVIFVIRSIEAVLFPVLISLLIAYLLDPTIDWLEERGFSRTNSILIFLGMGVIAVTVFVLVLYPTIANQVEKVGERLPQLVTTLETRTIPWAEKQFDTDLPDDVADAVSEYSEIVRKQLPVVAKKVSEWAGSMVGAAGPLIASLLNIVMIPVFTFYFLRDFDVMRLKVADFIPKRRKKKILDRARRADEVVGAWFRGQIEVAGILAGLYAAGLGVLFWATGIGGLSGVAIGLLTGLLNIVPYLGVFIGLTLSVLVVLIDFSGWGGIIGVAAVFGVVQVLEGYVITPKIVGEKVGLNPVTVIIVLLLGGEVLGLLGVLLAIPVAGVIRVLLPDIIREYKTSAFFTGEFDDGEEPDDSDDGEDEDVGGRHSEKTWIGVSLETAGKDDSSSDDDEDLADTTDEADTIVGAPPVTAEEE